MPNRSLGLSAYRRLLTAAGPLANLVLRYRAGKGKEDRKRMSERRGRASLARPPGPLVWVHAASVGEFLAVVPLVEAIVLRGFPLLVTTGTVTSAQLAATRLPPEAVHQYVPLDVPRYVQRFLAHWRPNLAIFAESELWPNLIAELHNSGTPIAVVNARMSERSFRRWSKAKRTIGSLLNRIDLCLAQSELDAGRLSALGAPRVLTTGNLKFDVPAPPADQRIVDGFKAAIGARPIFVAASTHAGEETVIARAHARAQAVHPNLLTIIVPRHPHRGDEAVTAAESAGLNVAQRSKGQQIHPDTRVYVADTIGELGLFYRLAGTVFMGGSLVPHGGQNPIEPAKIGAPVLHGPHVQNFATVYARLDEDQGALTVVDEETMAEAIVMLASNAAARADMCAAANRVVADFAGSLERTVAAIDPYLMQLRLGRA